jgi:surface antigen
VTICVSGFASVDRNLPSSLALRLGAVNAAGMVGSEGGSVGAVALGRTSTIIKPVAVPTAAQKSHTPTMYTVGANESLGSLAQKFGVSTDSIRWSNFDALKSVDRDVVAGQQVVVPPVDGVAVTIAEGDTIPGLAQKYSADPQAITDYNYVRDPLHLTPGDRIVIPGGRGPDFEQPLSVLRMPTVATSRSDVSSTRGGPAAGNVSGNRFAYGFCTWYVASRRPVPWLGDAWQWYGQAQSYGWATGQTPRAGAIMVTWESGWGHVAIVEKVNSDGTWLVSEMNFIGWAVISQRTISPGKVPLIGFIY